MAGKSFKAHSWFSPTKSVDLDSKVCQRFDGQSVHQNSRNEFELSQFLIKGWKGNGLFSKSAIFLEKYIENLKDEIVHEFSNRCDSFNKSLRLTIYNEFIEFAEACTFECHEIDDYILFWSNFKDVESPYRMEIDEFVNCYAFRVAFIYFFRVRFMCTLCEVGGIHYSETDLLNPNSFFTRIFQKGSSSELLSESLETNHYTSWYRPSKSFKRKTLEATQHFKIVTLTEVAKIFSRLNFSESSIDKNYSHSISHKLFGQFINLLLIDFPKWVARDGKSKTNNQSIKSKRAPAPLSCKFEGDYLQALALSHWLAQEENSSIEWDEIICPDFIGKGFKEGHFLKISFELQFLHNLVYIAKKQGQHPVTYISQIFKEKKLGQLSNQRGQISLFEDITIEKAYDRIVLNLTNFPSNNPHYFLINQIKLQMEALQPNGLLFVLSNQNLFVPSQSERIDHLLKTCQLEGHINFEELKGKGEISPHLYILKKGTPQVRGQGLKSWRHEIESPCANLRFKGDLSNFAKFDSINTELQNFLQINMHETAPILRKDLDHDLTFNYYQDAIKDGQLISSTNGDQSQITHPTFFDSLIKSCVRFSDFFHLESIGQDQANKEMLPSTSSYLIGNHDRYTNKHPLILIVDNRDRDQVRLEIILNESFKAKSYEYGFAMCYYFGLVPKRNKMSINLFRDYFISDIGRQITQRSLIGIPTKLKSNLNNLLIPKFFLDLTPIPRYIQKSLSLLELKSEDILTTHFKDLEKVFNSIEPIFGEIKKQYPCSTLGLLSSFKANLKNSIDLMDRSEGLNFNNPVLIEELKKAACLPLYPNAQDINLQFHVGNKEEVFSPLTHIENRQNIIGDKVLYCLELWSNEKHIVDINSEKNIIDFLNFLFSKTNGHPVGTLLQSIEIPSANSLNKIIADYLSQKNYLIQLENRISDELKNLFLEQITNH